MLQIFLLSNWIIRDCEQLCWIPSTSPQIKQIKLHYLLCNVLPSKRLTSKCGLKLSRSEIGALSVSTVIR